MYVKQLRPYVKQLYPHVKQLHLPDHERSKLLRLAAHDHVSSNTWLRRAIRNAPEPAAE